MEGRFSWRASIKSFHIKIYKDSWKGDPIGDFHFEVNLRKEKFNEKIVRILVDHEVENGASRGPEEPRNALKKVLEKELIDSEFDHVNPGGGKEIYQKIINLDVKNTSKHLNEIEKSMKKFMIICDDIDEIVENLKS